MAPGNTARDSGLKFIKDSIGGCIVININKNEKILVVGLGYRSGLSACNFLAEKGFSVSASDIKPESELKNVIDKLDKRVLLFAGNQNPSILEGFGLIVLSPGVPATIPLIRSARGKGIPVIAEIELAYSFMKGKLIAITGTDGKSTTTSLTGHILSQAGIKTYTGGNLGIPFIYFAADTDDDSVSVIELSSFQLETIDRFKPDAAAILNVTPDHLDRYESMEDYFAAKLRITENQSADDYYIYNRDSKILNKRLKGVKAGKLCFSLTDRKADAYYDKGIIFARINGKAERLADTKKMRILGMHNAENAMASILLTISVIKKTGGTPDLKCIEESCYSFKGLEHRMEMIGEYRGRFFINDSKATTVGAVQMALKSLSAPGILILGGRTKGDDYSRLIPSMKGKVRHLVLIGESAENFGKLFRKTPQSTAGSMDEAVSQAMKNSSEGNTIILSPACASYDMYSNFEERGQKFRESFEKLTRGEISWT